MRNRNSCLSALRILCQYLLSISFVIVVYRDRFISNVCIGSGVTSQMRRRDSSRRENARQNVFVAQHADALSLRVGSLRVGTAIFIYDVNKPLSGRITSAVAVCALPGHDGCDATATAAQHQRSGWVAAEQRQHDINHAHAHKFTMSFRSLSAAVCAASRLHQRRRHSTLSLAMLYSCRECFIAGIFILCPHTHTHTRTQGHSAHSLRAKKSKSESESERERAAVSVSNIC